MAHIQQIACCSPPSLQMLQRCAHGRAAALHLQGWVVASALATALFWQQTAFLGHDLGHSAVTGDRKVDNLLGLGVNAGVGIGMSWWKSTHNTHHTVVGAADSDPDIQVLHLTPSPPTPAQT